jgi:hypothetical protein
LVYFWDRVLLYAQADHILIIILISMLPYTAGMTGVCQCTQPLIEMRSLKQVGLEWQSSQSISWVARITSLNYYIWPECLFLPVFWHTIYLRNWCISC